MTKIEEIAAREAKATKGPWRHDGHGTFIFGPDDNEMVAEVRGWGHLQYLGDDKAIEVQKAVGEFLAHARTDIPYLLAQHRQLREALVKARGYVVERLNMGNGGGDAKTPGFVDYDLALIDAALAADGQE